MDFNGFLSPDNLILTVTLYTIYELCQALISALHPDTKRWLPQKQGFSCDAFPHMRQRLNHPFVFCRPLRPPLHFDDHALIFNRPKPNLTLEDDDDVYDEACLRKRLSDLPREEDRSKFITRHVNYYYSVITKSKGASKVSFADPIEHTSPPAVASYRPTLLTALTSILRRPPQRLDHQAPSATTGSPQCAYLHVAPHIRCLVT